MNYEIVEKDFVKRSLALLDQYDRLVRGQVSEDEQYEVTLLLNCLLGLLILPYEHCKRKTSDERKRKTSDDNKHKTSDERKRETLAERFPEIFAGDDIAIGQLPGSWGIENIKFYTIKVDGTDIPRNELTLRYLVALMRHSMAHSQFGDGGRSKPVGVSVTYTTAERNPLESVLLDVSFVNEYGGTKFVAEVPVHILRPLACLIALSFLENQRQESLPPKQN